MRSKKTSDHQIDSWLVKLAAFQAKRPWVPLFACAIPTLALGLVATRLDLKTQFDQLLPENQPSVIELNRVAARIPNRSNVFVMLEGPETAPLRQFADLLKPKLEALGSPWVVSAADGIQSAKDFLMPRAGLFLSSRELESLRDEINARYRRAINQTMGVDLDEQEPSPMAEQFEKRLLTPQWRALKRYPDGYFQSADGQAVVVIIRTGVASGDLTGSRQAFSRIQSVVEAARASTLSSIRVGYAGDLVTGLYEYSVVRDDLLAVGAFGLAMILAVILLFFRRMRALLVMAITIVVGLAWTFGLTFFAIGHLNVATGFLFSIVAGNGINFGIIYLARFLEERRANKEVPEALSIAHRTTWVATLTAALAAAASYASLGATDFRGFKHFAFIGAAGMILCWIATYAMTPSLLVLIERFRPSKFPHLQSIRARSSHYDAPFTVLVFQAPRLWVVLGLALAVLSAGAVWYYVRSDPIEYDMHHLQTDFGQSRELYRVATFAEKILGADTASSMVVLVDRLDQLGPLKRALEARRDATPNDKPFQEVHTLLDFVASDQEKKLPQLDAIRSKLVRARNIHLISDSDWARISPFIPPKGLQPYGLADLPKDLALPFTEKDGTRGRIALIEPAAGKDDSDLRYLMRWANSFRETRLPDGKVIRGSGRAVILADMLQAVLADMPKATLLSLSMTVLAVLLMFRRGKQALVVTGALALGVLWLGGAIALLDVRINFFNFVALPITFGIGVDYAVNIVQRYAQGDGVRAAMQRTGGAVVLCSLTTILGYLALTRSLNQSIRSLGEVAVLGEVCCLLAAMVVLPAGLLWWERRRRSKAHRSEDHHLVAPM